MIKTIITMVVTAVAGLIGYLVSDSFRERLAQQQRDKIANEVARGDEAAVNARIGRFRALGPWVVAALLVIGGCAVTRTVYVKERDKVTALRCWTSITEITHLDSSKKTAAPLNRNAAVCL